MRSPPQPFRYRRCTRCRSLHLENVPADLGAYYPDEYFSLPDLAGLRAQARARALADGARRRAMSADRGA